MPESLSTDELKRLRQLAPISPYKQNLPMYSVFMGDDPSERAGFETMRVPRQIAPGTKPIMRLMNNEAVSAIDPYVFAQNNEWPLPSGYDVTFLQDYPGYYALSGTDNKGGYIEKGAKQINPDLINVPASMVRTPFQNSNAAWPDLALAKSPKRPVGSTTAYITMQGLEMQTIMPDRSANQGLAPGQNLGNMSKQQIMKNIRKMPYAEDATSSKNSYLTIRDIQGAEMMGNKSMGSIGYIGELSGGLRSLFHRKKKKKKAPAPVQQTQSTQPTVTPVDPTASTGPSSQPVAVGPTPTQTPGLLPIGPSGANGSIPSPQPTPVPPVSGNVPVGTSDSWAVIGTMPDGTPYSYNFMTEDAASNFGQNVVNGGGTATIYSPDEIKQGLLPSGQTTTQPAQAGMSNTSLMAMLAIPAAAYFYFKHR